MRDAIEGMNGQNLDGRNITVNKAQSCRSGNGGGGSGGGGYGGSHGGGGYGGYGGCRKVVVKVDMADATFMEAMVVVEMAMEVAMKEVAVDMEVEMVDLDTPGEAVPQKVARGVRW
ncbi:hypothetical protein Dsin_004935 [Dipteronia sinensis]|uniref:Uncharacterized protein n=1 Tax=Dipteronia sinensis TaxID=43782 RepID=A0AAE0AVM2_9ROSI|nr:hypothetical protein Dsin_004935 [Dipteronia sinensis]